MTITTARPPTDRLGGRKAGATAICAFSGAVHGITQRRACVRHSAAEATQPTKVPASAFVFSARATKEKAVQFVQNVPAVQIVESLTPFKVPTSKFTSKTNFDIQRFACSDGVIPVGSAEGRISLRLKRNPGLGLGFSIINSTSTVIVSF